MAPSFRVELLVDSLKPSAMPMPSGASEMLEELKVERDALVASFMREIKSLTTEQKMVHHNRVAEIDAIVSHLEYEQMDWSERINYWTLGIHRSMRSCGEQGGDEIASLNKTLLLRLRECESEIDKMMPVVLVNLARLWSIESDQLVKRVEYQMETSFR